MSLPSSLDRNVCTPEEFQQSLLGLITCLTKGDTIGLVVIVEAGMVSLGAILCLFALIVRNVWPDVHEIRTRLFQQPMDLLLFSVLFADIIQAIGMILNIRWIVLGKVELGSFCVAQGIIKSIGATSVAFFTLVIAIYTFVGAWMGNLRIVSSMRIALGVVMGVWAFDAFLAMLGPLVNSGDGKPNYVSIAPYWCSTNKSYLEWITLSDYIWRWIALFFSLLIYIPLSLWARGNLINNPWWKPRFRRNPSPADRPTNVDSLVMLAYPVVYCILILPLTIVRWITWWAPQGHNHVPSSATFATDALFGLSGFFNVILLVTTRPRSALFGDLIMSRRPAREPTLGQQVPPAEQESLLAGQHSPLARQQGMELDEHARRRPERAGNRIQHIGREGDIGILPP